jgi:HEAT repeat protein
MEIIADTLFRLDCDRAVDFLFNALLELDPWSRVHIIDQLGTMPTRRALDCIARFVDDENEMVQESARSALQAAGFPFESGLPVNRNEMLDSGVHDRV